MKVNFKKYDSAKKPNIEIGSTCLCQCSSFCEEGVITAEYTREGFVFSGHGNIDEHVTGYVVLDL